MATYARRPPVKNVTRTPQINNKSVLHFGHYAPI